MVVCTLALKIACRLLCVHAQLMQMVPLYHVVLRVVTGRCIEFLCATNRCESRLSSVAHLFGFKRNLRERDEIRDSIN